MKEKPILFSGEMVKAILEGRKTQTRRVINLPPAPNKLGSWTACTVGGKGCYYSDGSPVEEQPCIWHTRTGETLVCPYGTVGDRLWVRETWKAFERPRIGVDGILYAADKSFVQIQNTKEASEKWVAAYSNGIHGNKWRPSIFMPRWASRITLEVTGIRVERVQDISGRDAVREGIKVRQVGQTTLYRDYSGPDDVYGTCPVGSFKSLWNSINEKRGYGWDANPWVWVVEFRRVDESR